MQKFHALMQRYSSNLRGRKFQAALCDVRSILRSSEYCLPSIWTLGKTVLCHPAVAQGCLSQYKRLCMKFMLVCDPIPLLKVLLDPHCVLPKHVRFRDGVSPVSERRHYLCSCGMKGAYAYASTAESRKNRKPM